MSRYSIYKKSVLQDKRSKKLNFEPDGREHYVYRITDYTRSEKEHYYGSHTPERGKKYDSLEEEFWAYRTSSKYNVLNENKKEQYKIKILKVFDNPADKMIYEAFLHQYFNVKLSSKFWNESNQTPFGYDTTGLKFKNSEETKAKKKAANKLKGNCLTVEMIEAIKQTRLDDVIDGLNSYYRAGLKCSETKLAYSKDRKLEISEKRKNTMGEEGIKKAQLKSAQYRRINNMNSDITRKGNITKKENLLNQLGLFDIVVYFEDGKIEKYSMFDFYYDNTNLPFGKIDNLVKEKYNFTVKKSGFDLFEVLIEYQNKNNKKYLHLENAIIKKERK